MADVPPERREPDPSEAGLIIPGVLGKIVAHKLTEVEHRKAEIPFRELEAAVAAAEPPRNFFGAVTRPQRSTAIIAEIKRASPSAGLIRPEYAGSGFSPETIARAYDAHGASAISCLTDENFFSGHLSYIERVKGVTDLPVLRKDFILDPWQLWESRAAGADAVLLIAECLTEARLIDLLILAQQLQMTALVEVHSMENLLKVRPHIGFPHPAYALVGINNRDLSSMVVDLNNTLRLVDPVDDPGVLVSESGIQTPEDLARLRAAGVQIALVGEHLMRQADPGLALAQLLGNPSR